MAARAGAIVRPSRTLKLSDVRRALRRMPFQEAARALGVSESRLRRDFPAVVYAARQHRKSNKREAARQRIIAQVQAFIAVHNRRPLRGEFGSQGKGKHESLPWHGTVLHAFQDFTELFDLVARA